MPLPESPSPFRLSLPLVLTAAAILALVSTAAISAMGSWLGVLLAVALIILLHAALLLALRSSHAAARHIHAHDSLLCPTCFYDLRNSAAAGPCPECGNTYDKASLPAHWQRVLAGEQPPP